jgi:formylglycine-generating enzyme required for sulfatase activity
MCLHWDGDRLMFTSNNSNGLYRVYEMALDRSDMTPHEITQIDEPDVDNYTGCWLADDAMLFLSTATMIGVPCVRGTSHIAHLYRLDPDRGTIRRLTFDQEHNWCPTMLPDGRVLYLRWEYSDIPHFVARILFTMNPDGTSQREYYGSNSYWPNSMFFAKPIPGESPRFTAVVSGHHDCPRMGELIVFDPARSRREAEGALQRIPGRGQPVHAVIADRLVSDSWPKFLHPTPLGGPYILTACQPGPHKPWGIYLVDRFDNLTLIREDSGQQLVEPLLWQPTPRPPVIPSLVVPGQPARVKMVDVHEGPGLASVPRGTVKALRVFSYAFSYRGMGGQFDRVGLDGPWDVRRILGTVPVAEDGSAFFEVPANTPVAFQPLDAKGRALQLMRSWITVMPGELQSCSGCHEPQNSTAGHRARLVAMDRPPATIRPWYGPPRGFSFNREVQPVLNRLCVACHDGKVPGRPDFTARPGTPFPPAYLALRPFVRGHTMESDMHLLTPCEFHASTCELVRMLENGHHGVRLDAEAWDRLNTWIDLNTPAHGTWTEIVGEARVTPWASRRRELNRRYAGVEDDPEDIELRAAAARATAPDVGPRERLPKGEPLVTSARTARTVPPSLVVEPCDRGIPTAIDLGNGAVMSFVRVPAGAFTSSANVRTRFASPFRIGAHEVRNRDFACFDPTHDSRIETGDFLQFSEEERGFPCNLPDQPVCRVSRERAEAFCAWLSAQTGLRCRLPSVAEWEWAARAGNAEPAPWGADTNAFAEVANLADQTFRTVLKLGWGLPARAVPPYRPAAAHVRDGYRVSAPVGTFRPNVWGLFDTSGNVWEWCRDSGGDGLAIACGGSWSCRPQHAGFDARVTYPAWQPVYDVGFRVLIEDPAASPASL